jgi:hypothetical protein
MSCFSLTWSIKYVEIRFVLCFNLILRRTGSIPDGVFGIFH